MEGLSAKMAQGFAGPRGELGGLGLESGPVDVVAQERMADMGQVDPDLMGAAGLEPAGEEARDRAAVLSVVALQDLPVGDRRASALAHCAAVAGAGVAIERSIDGAARPIRHAPDEGEVAARERTGSAMVGELAGEGMVRAVVL